MPCAEEPFSSVHFFVVSKAVQAGAVGATGDMQPAWLWKGYFGVTIRWICMLYNIVPILPSFIQIKNEAVIYLTTVIIGDSMKKFEENLQIMLFWLQPSCSSDLSQSLW